MDILNFISWIKGGRVVTSVDPAKTLIPVGLKDDRRDDGYLAGAITVEDLASQIALPSTLQQVLDNNHDLVNGNNFQGTDAGVGNTGIDVIGIGLQSAISNSGSEVVSIGRNAGFQNQGSVVNAVGNFAGRLNQGGVINVFGLEAGVLNQGNYLNAIGSQTARENTGNNVNAIGELAAYQNTGNNVIALGTNVGIANPLSGMFIISNSELPSYADHAAAVAAISPTGIPNNTYIYHNQATMSIGAVRL